MENTKKDLLVGIGITVVGACFLAVSLQSKMTSSFGPGPGFFPSAIAILVLLLGFAQIMSSWASAHNHRAPTAPRTTEQPNWGRIGAVILVGIGYAVLMPVVGYFISSVLALLAMLALFGIRNHLLPISILGAGVYYVTFINFMNVFDPGKGFLAGFLP